MTGRVELQKNVPSNHVQDIKWSLSCTDACVKAVADTVKSLQLRMDYFEEGMSVVGNLTKEISKLKEFVLTLTKETTEKKTYGTVSTMYEREYSPDCGLSNEERMIAAKVEEIYQDINSYTKWLKWKKMQEENGGRLKWSKLIENEVQDKKNNDTSYLLRE